MLEEYWIAGGVLFALGACIILQDLRDRVSNRRAALWEGECKRLQVRENVNNAFVGRDIEEGEWIRLVMATYDVSIDELKDAVRKSKDWKKLFHEDLKPYMEDVY